MRGRRGQQLHRLEQAAVLHPLDRRRPGQPIVARAVLHAHDEPRRPPGLQPRRGRDLERHVAAQVLAGLLPVDPHHRAVIRAVEPQPLPRARDHAIGRELEGVPADAFVAVHHRVVVVPRHRDGDPPPAAAIDVGPLPALGVADAVGVGLEEPAIGESHRAGRRGTGGHGGCRSRGGKKGEEPEAEPGRERHHGAG